MVECEEERRRKGDIRRKQRELCKTCTTKWLIIAAHVKACLRPLYPIMLENNDVQTRENKRPSVILFTLCSISISLFK